MNALGGTSHLGAAAVFDDEDVYGRNSDVSYEDDLLAPGLGPGGYPSDDEDGGDGKEVDEGKGPWPPDHREWKDNNDTIPGINFNGANKNAWKQTKHEVLFIRKMCGAGVGDFMKSVYGRNSRLFAKFKLFGIDSFYEFNKFMATFFFECRYGRTYQRLYDDPRVNTSDLLEPKVYLQMWRKIDDYHKFASYSPRAWKEFEGAFNEAMAMFIPQTEEDMFRLQFTYDDDKHHYKPTIRSEDRPHDENQTLKVLRHARDNAEGPCADAMVYSGSALPIHIHYRRKGETETTSFKKAVRNMFGFEEGITPPNLHGRVVFAADRG